jgi:hypothetical protein
MVIDADRKGVHEGCSELFGLGSEVVLSFTCRAFSWQDYTMLVRFEKLLATDLSIQQGAGGTKGK